MNPAPPVTRIRRGLTVSGYRAIRTLHYMTTRARNVSFPASLRDKMPSLTNYGDPDSLVSRLRRRRWDLLLEHFPHLAQWDVLDLGGTVQFWQSAPVQPRSVTVLNLQGEPSDSPSITAVTGDALNPPASIDSTYDLVVSNSLIEHVGGAAQRRQLAQVVRDRAPRHWVQTPNRNFPIEPHWVFPGMQFLPTEQRAMVAQHWPFGHEHSASRDQARHDVLEVELLDERELAACFPDSTIVHERLAGLSKSLIAVVGSQ